MVKINRRQSSHCLHNFCTFHAVSSNCSCTPHATLPLPPMLPLPLYLCVSLSLFQSLWQGRHWRGRIFAKILLRRKLSEFLTYSVRFSVSEKCPRSWRLYAHCRLEQDELYTHILVHILWNPFDVLSILLTICPWLVLLPRIPQALSQWSSLASLVSLYLRDELLEYPRA